MKKIYISIAIVIGTIVLAHAQYNGISYQGYYNNPEFSGEQTLLITLLKDGENGPVIYREETVATVLKGRFSIVIGKGNPQSSYIFDNLEWFSYNAVFCKVEWKRDTNNELLSLSQLMSVPYAFYS